MFAAQALFAGIFATNLGCGSWQNPLGVDDPNPRLSWQLQTTIPGARAQAQSACQILVATSSNALASDLGGLWNSGKVILDSPYIGYGGSGLVSEQQVFWKVRVWDQADQPSAWSSVGTWTMGLLSPTDWQGSWLAVPALSLSGCSWIWYPEGSPASSAPVASRYFRKSFVVRSNSALTNATLLLTADNSFTAYINGTQVGQGQDWTTVTPVAVTSQLVSGSNILAIAAANGGTSPNPAGLIGKLILSYADGQQINIQMDATWKAAKTSQTGWQLPSFNDSSWVAALLLGTYGMSPWLTGVTIQTQSGLPIFRREFVVQPGLQRAVVSICGLGQYELTANGTKVGDALLAPGWSKYDKTCLYDTLDLTSYLTNGGNALGVMLGNGMYNVPSSSRYSKFTGSFGLPKLLAQVHLFYANGTSQVIASDSQWLTAPGPITFSSVFGGEDYDARLLSAGWNQAGFNGSGWSPAALTGGPGGTLRGTSRAAPPIKAIQALQPIRTNVLSSSVIVYDLGQNASLIPSLTAHGQAGAVIQITPAELTNSAGTVNRASCGGGTAYWQYTLAGTGAEIWFPRFFYHGCRFLQVQLTAAPGFSQLPVVDNLQGVAIQSASAPVGDFSCSNDLFNRTRALIRWAQRNNLISILTDCPHRERLGWLEQYNLHGPSLRYEFDVGQLFSKTMQDMADSQTSAGLVPDIAPEYQVFSGGFRDSPEWGSSVIIVPWQHYLFTGDDTLLRRHYSEMTNYFKYLQNQAVNNFINYPNGLGDWYDIGPNAPGYPQNTPVSLTADAYYCQDAQILAQVAAEIGQTGDASRFNSLAADIATAFNNAYYSPANGSYSTGSQTAQSMPLYLGLVNPANQAAVSAALIANVRSEGLTAGDIGHRYLLRALADMGRSDVVFDLHSGTNNPGYGYILNTGANSLTEGWDGSGSQDHFMLGHITEWFYHDLAGIQPDAAMPGFKHVIIKPSLVGGITWVNANYDSIRGEIGAYWALSNNLVALTVTIPVGSIGSVYLPTLGAAATNLVIQEGGTVIWQNGAPSGGSPGVTFDHVQGAGLQTYVVWAVASGSYQFAWNVFPPPTGLSAAASDGQVGLSWNAESNVTGYNVKRSSTIGGPYTTLANGVTDTNYTDDTAANGGTYFYVVSAVNNSLESANSFEVAATPRSPTFAWSAPVKISTADAALGLPGTNVRAACFGATSTSITVTLSNGTNIVFRGDGTTATCTGQSTFTGANTNNTGNANFNKVLNSAEYENGPHTITLKGLNVGQRYSVQLFALDDRNPATVGFRRFNYQDPNDATDISQTATMAADVYMVGTFVATNANVVIQQNLLDSNNGNLNALVIRALPPQPSTSPPVLAWRVNGSQIQFVWPLDHTGWRLQAQTNSSNIGLNTNWVTVPGSSATNLLAFPISTAKGSVFFRLVYP
jgi:hypothetical protein